MVENLQISKLLLKRESQTPTLQKFHARNFNNNNRNNKKTLSLFNIHPVAEKTNLQWDFSFSPFGKYSSITT